jgi:hypothetical protein
VVGGEVLGHVAQRLAERPAVGVEQGDLQGATGGVPLDPAGVAGDGG